MGYYDIEKQIHGIWKKLNSLVKRRTNKARKNGDTRLNLDHIIYTEARPLYAEQLDGLDQQLRDLMLNDPEAAIKTAGQELDASDMWGEPRSSLICKLVQMYHVSDSDAAAIVDAREF